MLRTLTASTLILCLCTVTTGCGNAGPGAQAATAGYDTNERPKPAVKKDAPGKGSDTGIKPGNPDGSPPAGGG